MVSSRLEVFVPMNKQEIPNQECSDLKKTQPSSTDMVLTAKVKIARSSHVHICLLSQNFFYQGHEFVVPQLRYLRRKLEYEGIIGVNMGMNKFSNALHDYPTGVKVFQSDCQLSRCEHQQPKYAKPSRYAKKR